MSGSRRSALVTGGAGFIGSHLADRLIEAGWSVRILDDFSSGRERNLLGPAAAAEVLRGDVLDADRVAKAVAGVEVVFHQAAVPSVPRSVAEPERTNDVNVTGTLRILEAARRAQVRRVVFAASSSAYGDTPELPKVETMPVDPLSPYALQKYAGEAYCRLYHRFYGLETVALRYFNVFGPRQDPKSEYAAVIPRFVTACLEGRSPVIYGDGEQTRDFTYVADAVEANLLAADAPRAAGTVVNVAGGHRTSLNRLLAWVLELTGVDVEAVYEESRPGDVRDSLADLRRASDVLGYRPRTQPKEGLGPTVDYFRERLEGDQAA